MILWHYVTPSSLEVGTNLSEEHCLHFQGCKVISIHDHEDSYCDPSSDIVYSDGWAPTCRRNILPPSSGLQKPSNLLCSSNALLPLLNASRNVYMIFPQRSPWKVLFPAVYSG
jgi:hypothetical protein